MEDLHQGSPIRRAREERGVSQRILARKCQISRGRLRRLEGLGFEAVTFGELKRISSALGIELGEIFFAPEERREEKGPRVLPSGETAFSVEARDAGYRLVSYFPPSPDIFLGKIFVRAETRLPSCRVPRVEKVFLLMLMGELRVERPGEIHELKAGDALLFPGRLPYEIENPILRESAAFLVTVPAPRL